MTYSVWAIVTGTSEKTFRTFRTTRRDAVKVADELAQREPQFRYDVTNDKTGYVTYSA